MNHKRYTCAIARKTYWPTLKVELLTTNKRLERNIAGRLAIFTHNSRLYSCYCAQSDKCIWAQALLHFNMNKEEVPNLHSKKRVRHAPCDNFHHCWSTAGNEDFPSENFLHENKFH
jgi:hypothetical protein